MAGSLADGAPDSALRRGRSRISWLTSHPLWLQLVIGWLPMWGLYTLIIGPANPIHRDASLAMAAGIAFRSVVIAAALSPMVRLVADRFPWPRSVRLSFVLSHLAASAIFASMWVVLTTTLETLLRPPSLHFYVLLLVPNLVLGAWFYVMIAGTIYATRATARAGRAEAVALQSQLAALRSQLNPHFLFNALHTVVQLIPRDPDRASVAAEQLAGLLRTTIEEDREVVSFAEERHFVERYLALERLRFGDRLDVQFDVGDDAAAAEIPAFALQTLVENAVRHGAGPRVEPTRIRVSARKDGGMLRVEVQDTGAGVSDAALRETTGTGLQRLRERLVVLYGDAARLDLTSQPGAGFTARLAIPADDE